MRPCGRTSKKSARCGTETCTHEQHARNNNKKWNIPFLPFPATLGFSFDGTTSHHRMEHEPPTLFKTTETNTNNAPPTEYYHAQSATTSTTPQQKNVVLSHIHSCCVRQVVARFVSLFGGKYTFSPPPLRCFVINTARRAVAFPIPARPLCSPLRPKRRLRSLHQP